MEFQDLSNKIMTYLHRDFGLQDDPMHCNMMLKDLGDDINPLYKSVEKELRHYILITQKSDWPSKAIQFLNELILVGSRYGVSDEVCPECRSPEWYYTGGMMLCGNCEHSARADSGFEDGDITDFSGFVTLDRNQIR